MIGKIIRGDDFAGLLRYLTAARKDLTPDHIETRHIVNPDLAAQEMAAVAAAATHRNRVQRPVAHIIIGWRKDENPTLIQQKKAARRILEKLDLQSHQAAIVVHPEAKLGLRPGPDGRAYETHIGINRVAFDGTVAKLDWDFARLEVACSEVAKEMGFLQVAGRHNGVGDLPVPGLGNAISSITAQTGKPTLADELRQDHATMDRLRQARREGWAALLAAFEDSGIVIRPGRHRRRTELHRGLVMVDRDDPERRIKISSLNSPGESWSSIALEKELGAMPAGWDAPFAEQLEKRASKFDLQLGPCEIPSDRAVSDEAKKPVDLAAEIRADPSRLARLRAARQHDWAALIAAFDAQGIGIASGINARRGTTSGLVMVDLANPSRRQALSALDTPTEKWGAGGLAKTLGPWPGVSTSSLEKPSASDRTEHANSSRSPEKAADISLDRDATYRAYVDMKARIVSGNRDLSAERGARMDAMVAGQRRQRDRQHALRRLRRDIVRGVFGWRSLIGRALNAAADALFDIRMRVLARTQRDARSALSSEIAARRASVPTWAEYLRAAQHDHARTIAERHRLAEAKANWLLEIRRRRDRLKQGDEAKSLLTRARTATDRRLQERYGSRVDAMLDRLGLDQTVAIAEPMVAGMTPSERRRLPMLIEGLCERRRLRERLWLDGVRARRDRLRGSDQARKRLDRAREGRDRRAGEAAFAAMRSRRSGLQQESSHPGEGLWAAIEPAISQRQGGLMRRDQTEPAAAPSTNPRHATTLKEVEQVVGATAGQSDETAGSPDQRHIGLDRKSLVVRIAMVLIANDTWSVERGHALGQLVGEKGADLWKAAHGLSRIQHAQRHPAKISRADVRRVWVETRRQARTAAFPELLDVVDGFGREMEGRSRV